MGSTIRPLVTFESHGTADKFLSLQIGPLPTMGINYFLNFIAKYKLHYRTFEDLMDKFGCIVHGYDHTVKKLTFFVYLFSPLKIDSEKFRGNNIEFHKIGLGNGTGLNSLKVRNI